MKEMDDLLKQMQEMQKNAEKLTASTLKQIALIDDLEMQSFLRESLIKAGKGEIDLDSFLEKIKNIK